ncbi:YjhX family toxin [Entomohabitans teleogrylli]
MNYIFNNLKGKELIKSAGNQPYRIHRVGLRSARSRPDNR